jgi:hypothetical protein
MGPRFGVLSDRFQSRAVGAERRRDRESLVDNKTGLLEPMLKFCRVQALELPRNFPSGRLLREAFSHGPGGHHTRRGAQEAPDAPSGQTMEIPAPFPRPRGDLDQENATGRKKLDHSFQEPFAAFPRKPKQIAHGHYGPEGAGSERRASGVSEHDLWQGEDSGVTGPVGAKLEQHRSADVECDSPLRTLGPQDASESAWPGSSIEYRPGGRSVSNEKSFPQFPKEVALSRSLIPLPLPAGPVLIRGPEARPRVTRRGGIHRPRRTRRDAHLRARAAPPDVRLGRHGPRGSEPGDIASPLWEGASPFIGGQATSGEENHMPYYECPKCGGGYVIDVPPSARPVCDRDGARLKRASDASYERNARRD